MARSRASIRARTSSRSPGRSPPTREWPTECGSPSPTPTRCLSGRELRRRGRAHAHQPRPRPARRARGGRTRRAPRRIRGRLRRRLRIADLRLLRPVARRNDGARAAVDDHELAARHARAPAPAAAAGLRLPPRRRTSTPRPDRARSCSTSPRPTRRWSQPPALPAADVDAWLADQRRSAADGTFFAACNYYAYIARR